MLKVIIADDEARVCSLIKMLIDWEGLGLTLSGTAANGVEALELVEQCNPDILITDIRMPGCSGLELIEKAKRLLPQLEIVIISGYAHFEYARNAIQYDVSDYLLKPINQQQLDDTLRKLGERCRARQQMSSEIEELRRSSRENTQRLQNRMLQDLLSGSLRGSDGDILWEKYHFKQETEYVQLVLLQFDYDDTVYSHESLLAAEETAMQICAKRLGETSSVLMSDIRDSMGALLLGFGRNMQDQIRRTLHRCLNQVIAQTVLSAGVECTIALSPAVSNSTELGDACTMAHSILMERLICGTSRILDSLPLAVSWKTEETLKPYRQVLADLPKIQTTQTMEQAIDHLEQEVSSWRGIRGEMVFDLVRAAGQLFLQQPQVMGGREKYERFAARIAHIGHISWLFEAMKSMIVQETEALIQQQRSASVRPIRLAQDYVLKHYSDPLTLEKVSEAVGFSASYFSFLFKKETGENFLHYLTRIRMDRAKELLSQTDLSISEISEQVGYNDSNYFTKMFRKETRLSPGQYRKVYG